MSETKNDCTALVPTNANTNNQTPQNNNDTLFWVLGYSITITIPLNDDEPKKTKRKSSTRKREPPPFAPSVQPKRVVSKDPVPISSSSTSTSEVPQPVTPRKEGEFKSWKRAAAKPNTAQQQNKKPIFQQQTVSQTTSTVVIEELHDEDETPDPPAPKKIRIE